MAASRKTLKGAGAKQIRIYKTKDFARAARSVGITDAELCKTAADLIEGKGGENLGGGVWKVKLRNNDFRAILLENQGVWLIYVYLFDKQDEKNIGPKALKAYKLLATKFKAMPQAKFDELVEQGTLVEICRHG